MVPGADGYLEDAYQEVREAVCQALNRDLTDADRSLVLYLLKQEIVSREDDWGFHDNMRLCAYMLFKLGHVEDSILLWRAKGTNFDSFCGVDVQLLAGGGLEETISWLKGTGDPEAAEAAEYLEGCRATGDFSYDYRASLRSYFDADEAAQGDTAAAEYMNP